VKLAEYAVGVLLKLFGCTVIDTVLVADERAPSETWKVKLSAPVYPTGGVYEKVLPVRTSDPVATAVSMIYVRASPSISVAESDPVSTCPLSVDIFPVTLYDHPVDVGASFTHVTVIVTIPVFERDPERSDTLYENVSVPQ
jgi:hypothetical protein